MFHKGNKNGNQLIRHGQTPSVSCRSQWSLLKPTVCSHSVLSELNRPGQSWHSQSRQTEASSSLTGLEFMSADAYWTLDRLDALPLHAGAQVCGADWPRPVSGIFWIPAAVPDTEVKRSRRGWFGSLKGCFWSGVGGKSTKSAAWHWGRGYRRFLTLHRSGHPALLGQHQQQPVWLVSNSCPAAARAQLSARM